MNRLTIRGFDDELKERIWGLAEREGISLNRAGLRLLRKGAGIIDEGEGMGRVGELAFSAIVLGELLSGFRGGRHCQPSLETLNSFLDSQHVRVANIGMTTADRYSRIAVALRSKGRLIPTNDMWTAAHAMETGADLVSADRRFEHVDGIALAPIEAN